MTSTLLSVSGSCTNRGVGDYSGHSSSLGTGYVHCSAGFCPIEAVLEQSGLKIVRVSLSIVALLTTVDYGGHHLRCICINRREPRVVSCSECQQQSSAVVEQQSQ